ncbi:MAG: hypothetical protein WBO36_04530 [Saprospiraceae bacterium]
MSNINRISKGLLILGVSCLLIHYFLLTNHWLEASGYFLIIAGVVFAKHDIINIDAKFGPVYYYSILIIFFLLIYYLWFVMPKEVI